MDLGIEKQASRQFSPIRIDARPLDGHQPEIRSKPPQIVGIAGNNGLARPLGANNDVGINNVGGCSLGQQETDSGCVRSIKRNEVGASLPDQPGEAGLPGRIPDGLREGGGWYRDPHAALYRPRDEQQHPTVILVQRDQSASVKYDPVHAARPLREPDFWPFGPRCASAHARSFFVSGPPVS